MNQRVSDRRAELIERLAGIAAERLPREKAGAATAFLRTFYANVALDDIADRRPEDLYGAALALWTFARQRKPGEAKVRLYCPKLAEHGWRSRHSVIEIVNDDMPFLVDSVTAELNRHNLTVHLVIHPVVGVVRDAAGEAKGVGAFGEGGTLRESLMHVEVDEESDAAACAAICEGLRGVLADVRSAVADWRKMLEQAESVTADLSKHPPPVPAHELASAHDFLGWLAADHFTLLGYREYEYSGEGTEARANVVPGAGLGLLRDDGYLIFDGLRNLSTLPPEVQDFVRRPTLLKIAKANRRSTVHRPAYLDTIGVKRFDKKGKVVGERLFLGLFTSSAYNQSPRDIPLLRDKVSRVLSRAGFAPNSHDGKALQHILDGFPRDELFQISDDELFEISLGILHLQDRQRIALFVRKDSFERFVSCLVYVPHDIYTTDLRLRFQAILETACAGKVTSFSTQVSQDSVLARVHFIVNTAPGQIPTIDVKDVTRRLTEASRTFRSLLQQALVEGLGEERGLSVLRRYADAFPAGYRERFTADAAVADIERVEEVAAGKTALAMGLYRPIEAEANEVNFKIFHAGKPVALSDVLPMLEHMGLRVISEMPYRIEPAGAAAAVWMHDFGMQLRDAAEIDLSQVKAKFETAFAQLWAGAVEDDGFNRLVLGAGLDWRQVAILRTYCKYLRQVGIPFSQAYMEETLASNGKIAARLIDLFLASFDPAAQVQAETRKAAVLGEINQLLDAVTNLDQDRILRRFLNLILATLRTNYFQKAADGGPKPYISIKLDSSQVEELPLPRPMYEIFVASPRVEAIHLRGGKVARGGIRWSDRREDFRTEVLGLMKAQMVKNAVIVPVGSKGGFVVKRPPVDGSREALQAEVVECYKTLIRGMLDITDNRGPDGIVPPKDVARRDGDDPYLVVAADKGTATFSDIANSVSAEYGFWLGDAFASGGSAGYDHKGMGITARGGWESVKRHFRELGLDTQAADFTVAGVGDMSGDVFGNAMLLSEHIRLIAAFDHRHIFVDPNPDAATSFKERKRLFALPRSSWADYDAKLISKGGGVFERKAKSIRLTPEIKAAFEIAADTVTPADLMRAILKAKVDLIWFGGIGTFIKASSESHVEAGDRTNDAVRIDGRDIRARVVGEGANLGVTQRGRIEYARCGGRINTDAIDNSAGVDTSDHEVNIKVLLGDIVARGDMTQKQRDKLLAEMTSEVGELVLRDNYLQTQALSVAETEGPAILDRDIRLIRALEKGFALNRGIEYLPDDEELTRRLAANEQLTRPERAVLLAYSKLWLFDQLQASDLPDDPYLADDLLRYFPRPLRKRQAAAISRHQLRREIIATFATNSLVNHVGPWFIIEMAAKTGAAPSEVARAYTATRQIFALRPLWSAIEALDGRVATEVQYRALIAITRLVERACLWLLRSVQGPLDIGATIAQYEPAARALEAALPGVLDPARAALFAERVQALMGEGVDDELATTIAGLGDLTASLDLARIAKRFSVPIEAAARVYFGLGTRLAIDWMRHSVERVKAETEWQKLALAAVVGDLNALQAEAATTALASANGDATKAVESWTTARHQGLQRVDALITEVRASPTIDLAALTVLGRELRSAIAAG